jgi:hypothetical protein
MEHQSSKAFFLVERASRLPEEDRQDEAVSKRLGTEQIVPRWVAGTSYVPVPKAQEAILV